MAPFRVPIEKGELKSKLKSRYELAYVTKKGTTVYEATEGYMKVLDKSGHIFLKNYEYKWEGGETIIIEGGKEGKCIVTAGRLSKYQEY
jgi:hypothetical protein